jgi:hypothetical protein
VNILKVVLLVAAVGAGYHQWSKYASTRSDSEGTRSESNGFVSVAMPPGAKRHTVLVFAPKNCPSEAAQRANHLAETLEGLGVPVQRSDHFSLEAASPSKEERERLTRTVAVLKGAIPAVFIDGMGASNPSVEAVLAQYNGTQ